MMTTRDTPDPKPYVGKEVAVTGGIATRDTPEATLKAAGFEPPENVCASCGHDGGDHDGGNWCLLCPRPNRPARPIAGRLAVGWCYFASMTEEQKWEHGLAILDGWTLVPKVDSEKLAHAFAMKWGLLNLTYRQAESMECDLTTFLRAALAPQEASE